LNVLFFNNNFITLRLYQAGKWQLKSDGLEDYFSVRKPGETEYSDYQSLTLEENWGPLLDTEPYTAKEYRITPQFDTEKMVQGVIERLKQETEMSANSEPAEK
jgi:hypothetical protein